MYNDINTNRSKNNNRALAGLFLIALGGIYLVQQCGLFFFPFHIVSWPMILILIGVLSGIKHNFQNRGAYILIAIGSFFLISHIIGVTIYFFWPLIMIAIGVSMMTGRGGYLNHRRDTRDMNWGHDVKSDNSINL